MGRRLGAAILLILPFGAFGAATKRAPDATSQDAVAAVVDAFKSHDIVAMDEGAHGNLPSHRFRLALIQDRRFSSLVNDVVVEFGNARYQDIADRFVHGEPVSDDSLRHIW
jgi:hypothetical protein